MEGFTKYSPIDRSLPTENGAYNIAVYSRDGETILRVAYYSVQGNKWFTREVSEYGYEHTYAFTDDYISYFKKIEGVTFEIVPESYKFDFSAIGVELNEDDHE